MTEHDGLIDAYLAAWNETDPAARRDLIARAWTEDARYLDPMLSAEGRDGLTVASALDLCPELLVKSGILTRRKPTGKEAEDIRFGWELAPEAGGPPVVRGVDFATLSADGRRLRSVTGFFDAAPAAA